MVVFTVAGSRVAASGSPFVQTWFGVGAGTALATTFSEPFWTAPRSALINAAGGLLVVVATHPQNLRIVWIPLLVMYAAVLIASAYLALAGEAHPALKVVAMPFCRALGRAVVIGGSALVLEIVALAHTNTPGWPSLVFGSLVLLVALIPDWPGMIIAARSAREGNLATATAALGPRLLLISAPGTDLPVGATVEVSTGASECVGTVIAHLPHASGLRLQVALQSDAAKLCARYPAEIRLKKLGQEDVVGAVGPGTTARSIDFSPSAPLNTGDPLRVEGDGDRRVLYQITDLELIRTDWAGSAAVIPRAHASLVGEPGGGHIRFASGLPDAHGPIKRWADLADDLPDGYERIGRVKGTQFPIGINVDDVTTGHIAIMGMSGMGKTSMAQHVSQAFGRRCLAVVLDTTGEYRQKLGYPVWDETFDGTGHRVCEPTGVPPQKAAEIIQRFMTQGVTEYGAGTPEHRVVTLEEAHTFLPEFGFRDRNDETYVAISGRCIMQSRKFGLRFVIVSQRSAVVTKSALSQCENYIAFKTIDDTSLNYLESVVGSDVRRIIAGLARFEAVCVGPAFNSEAPVIITTDPPPPVPPSSPQVAGPDPLVDIFGPAESESEREAGEGWPEE
jgi:hypothetical protein